MKLKTLWKNKFDLFLIISIIGILIFGIYNLFSDKKGSWTKNTLF